MAHTYFNPVRSVYAQGALAELPELVGGRPAALVTFSEARALGLVARIEALLRKELRCVIEDVRANPDVAELGPMYEAFWREHADVEVIVAVGGGSAIDTAKALMVGTASRGFSELMGALAAGHTLKPARVMNLIAVPTTAGTGSEVTPWATLWDREKLVKHSLHLRETWPSVALIDPELMLSLPEGVTLQSGLDALSHALESIWNVNANPISDTFAIAAAREILEVLPQLMRSRGDVALRGRMAVAALKAGMAFSNTRTALAHSISYEMTLRHGLAHGIACSFSLPMVLELALGHRTDRDLVLGQALGWPLDTAARKLTEFIEQFGVSTKFSDYGVGAEEAERLIAHAMTGTRGRNFIGVTQ